MEVKVFGPGCARCEEAEKRVREVTAGRDDIIIIKVADFKDMMAAGVMSTPAVSVDGVIKCTGRVPEKTEIRDWLGTAAG